MKIFYSFVLLFLLNCSTQDVFPPPTIEFNATIYRDIWGVPHIFGETDADVAYGLAYAHAEDDFKTIEDVLLATRAQLSTKVGRKGTASDYLVHLLKIEERVNANYHQLSSDVIELLEGYAAGINYYLTKFPNKNKNDIFPVDGKDLLAGFLFRTPLMFGLDWHIKTLLQNEKPDFALNKEESSEYIMYGSNVFAINANRTDNGSTFLAINTHQPWEGPVTWYEAHLHSEDGLNINGGLFPGSPVVLTGHNKFIGWSHTVNDPDLVDIYELTINPENEYQYKMDEEWIDFKVDIAKIKVKLLGPLKWTFKREVLWSMHGPVIRTSHGTYAIRYAGFDKIKQVEQWYRMNKAQNITEFEQAMQMMQIPMFNTGYADYQGNLLYIYNALLPKRLENYNWAGILPGNNSELIWNTYYPYDSLPQIKNPESGFFQNCNSTPYLASFGEDNPDIILPKNTGIETFQTNRAMRVHELFGADKKISKEEFYSYKYDTYYSEKSSMNIQINKFLSETETKDPIILRALQLIKNWDLGNQEYNKGAALAMLTFKPSHNVQKNKYHHSTIMTRLKESCDFLMNEFGRLDIELGQLLRLKRGDVNLPLGGAPDVIRAIYPIKKGNELIAWNGDCYFEIVEWDSDGKVNAESIHQYGTATSNPNSPHYSDQSELFSQYKMKSVLMDLEDIKLNLKTTSQIP